MTKKRIFFLFSLILLIIFFFYLNLKEPNNKKIKLENNLNDISNKNNSESYLNSSSLNIIENVIYSSIDNSGNEFLIKSKIGKIDISDSNVIFLTDVIAIINLTSSKKITIESKFGKYNSSSFDTTFSENVTINYLDNNIIGDKLDYYFKKNLMIISGNIIYKNLDNSLKADLIELNTKTRNINISMYDKKNKINIKNVNNKKISN